MSPVVARFVGKVDGRLLTSFGVFWMGLMAFWRTGFTTDVTFWNIALPQFIMGFGMPFFFISTTNLAMSSVDPEETASASGLANFLRTMGAAFATSIMTTTWDSTANRKHELLAGALPNPQATIDALMARGMTHEQALTQLDRMVQVQAIMISTNQMFMAAGVVFLIAVAVVWLAPKPKPMTGGPMGGH
jgi:DHA2 family multidrug resistance protein